MLIAMGIFSSLFGLPGSPNAKRQRYATLEELRKAVMAAMRAHYPGVTVQPDANDPAKYVTDGDSPARHTIDLTNLFNRMLGYPDDDPEELIRQHVGWLADSHNRAVTDENLLMVLRTTDYVNQLVGKVAEPFVGDLSLVLMADMPDSLSTVDPDELDGKSIAQAKEIALGNIREWLPKIETDDQLGPLVLYYVEDNTMLSPSLVLLDEFWASIKKRFPGDALIAIPRRDQLFIADATEEGRAMARKMIEVTFADDFALLSDRLYARRNGKIVVEEN